MPWPPGLRGKKEGEEKGVNRGEMHDFWSLCKIAGEAERIKIQKRRNVESDAKAVCRERYLLTTKTCFCEEDEKLHIPPAKSRDAPRIKATIYTFQSSKSVQLLPAGCTE